LKTPEVNNNLSVAKNVQKFSSLTMKKNMFYGASPLIFQRAKELRNTVTHAEMIIWNYLRGNQSGFKFRRQHPVGNFILDFYCHQLKLAIEIDGSIHNNEETKINDAERQKILEAEGIKVIRFKNEEVMKKTEDVIKKINVIIGQNKNDRHDEC
jgi:imidazole glycerol-phosphate synthase subunit HisF